MNLELSWVRQRMATGLVIQPNRVEHIEVDKNSTKRDNGGSQYDVTLILMKQKR